MPTYREALGRIVQTAGNDVTRGNQMMQSLTAMTQDPSTPFYKQYAQPTNPAVGNLQSLGFDTSNLTAEWIDANRDWIGANLITSDTTGAPTKPGKKATWEQNVAYQLYQWNMAEGLTQQAEKEREDAIAEAKYWAGRTDLNLSDDGVIGKVREGFSSKYPTLAKLESRDQFKPIEINRGVDFSDDDLYAGAWEGRNPDYNGNIQGAMVQSYLGNGNVWKDNPEIDAKLDWNNKSTYAPYSVGMTLQDEGLYFGVGSFGETEINRLKNGQHPRTGEMLDPNDRTAMSMVDSVLKADERTVKAEAEKAALDKQVDAWINKDYPVQRIEKKIDAYLRENCPTLLEMDKSLERSADSVLAMTRPVDYRRVDVDQYVTDSVAERTAAKERDTLHGTYNAMLTGTANAIGLPKPTPQEKEVIKAKDAELLDSAAVAEKNLTQAEQTNFGKAGSTNWLNNVSFIDACKQKLVESSSVNLEEQLNTANKNYTKAAFTANATIKEYETAQANYDKLVEEQRKLQEAYGDIALGASEKNLLDEVGLNAYVNGIPVKLTLEKDQTTGQYHYVGAETSDSISTDLGFFDNFGGEQAFMTSVENSVAQFNEYADNIREASLGTAELSDEDRQNVQKLYAANAQVEEAHKYLVDNQKKYDQAVKDEQKARAEYNRAYNTARIMGYQTDGGLYHSGMIDAALEFGSKPPKERRAYSATNLLDEQMRGIYDENGEIVWHGDVYKKAAEQKDIVQQNIEGYENLLTYLGDDIPQEYRDNIQLEIEQLQWQSKDYDYFMMSNNDDYDEMVKKGKTEYGIDGIHRLYYTSEKHLYGNWQVMTDEERDRVFYLLARDGEDAAEEYYRHLEQNGMLKKRDMEEFEESMRLLAQESPVLASFISIGTAPVSAITSGAALVQSLATGESASDSPLMMFNNLSKVVNEEIVTQIHDRFENAPVLEKIVSGAHEILNNRLRSYMTGGAYSFLGEFGEVVNAFPMAMTAMADEVMENLDNDVAPWKAWALGAITFLGESVTEGIKIGNEKEARELGLDPLAGLKELIKTHPSRAISEVVGESLNEAIERGMNRAILGDESEHAQRVWNYRVTLGVSKEEAEIMATKDDIYGVLHTALISFLSPGLDVVQFAGAKTALYQHYNRQAKAYGTTIGDIRSKEQTIARYSEANANGQIRTAGNAPVLDVARYTPIMPNQQEAAVQEKEYVTDMEILETAKGSGNASDVSASIASVLKVGEENADRANAAAVRADSVFENGAESVQEILEGGLVEKHNINTLKVGIQYAVLGGENSECNRVVQSEEFRNATPDRKANMLAVAVLSDSNNQAIQESVETAVHENRVAEAEKELIANGALTAAKEAYTAAEEATAANEQAQTDLDTKKAETEAAAKALEDAVRENAENPTADNAKRVASAATELGQRDESAMQYEQHKENTQAEQEKAEAKAESIMQKALADVRQQAEAQVAQIDQQRAEAAAQLAEQQRIAAEQKAQAQAEEDERSGKAWENRRDGLIEDLLNQEHLEGEERDTRREELLKRADQIKLGKIDMTGMVNNAEGFLAVSAFGRKLGIGFQLSDNLPDNARGMYENGTVYLNNNLIKKGKLTIGQALVEASLHEITHSMENTKNYKTYRQVVLDALFTNEDGVFDQAAYDAAIDQKIADYRGSVNQELSREKADAEIVADFARTHLNGRDVVKRFMDAGLGGKMRNTLHNINQAIKNFRLQGEEKVTAEYLRRAERAFQKAMDEVARTAVHPDGGQFSIAQIAQATEMRFDEETRTLYDKNGNEIDGVNNKITADMIGMTPVGLLIRNGLSDQSTGVDENGNAKPSQQAAAMEMMAGLMNMVARYRNSNLVWEIGSATLSSTFSALKSNSDPQYATTVDFGTVCAKTQAIIDVMSQVMLDRVKSGKYGGLTREEIMKVYNETHKAGLSVPCPVCYVFSRWMGVPSLLGQMSTYQHDYVVTKKDADGNTILNKNGDAVIDVEATQAKVNEYIKNAEAKYGDAKAINNRKTQLQNQQAKLQEQRLSVTNKEEDMALLTKMTELDKQIGEVSAYNWVTQALCKKDKNGNYVVDEKFRLTPDEILFDLNRTGEFAGYEKNWRYRNTRCAGMGKAIMPYSGETIGDILYGVKAQGRQIKNPWLNKDEKAAARQLKQARERAKKQNLVGGQRLQSTSDFRPEWGLDYLMSFLELQAAGSKVQMYTKVAEAVDFFASVGADVNLSIMAKNNGFHEASAEEIAGMTDEQREAATVDGKIYVMDFSNITGMDYGQATALKNKYDSVQMILVGMNDTHIRLALKNSDIDFVIPWHSSGNSKDVLSGLISSVGERLNSSVDYTTTQTDMVKGTVKRYKNEKGETVEYTVPGKQTETQKALWDARVKLLTKGGNALTQEERRVLLSNPYTADLYNRFTKKGVDPDCYGVKLNKSQATQIFLYEYWDTSSTKENADVNGKRFVEYCEAMGIVPRFSQFKDDPGYWKLLIDRPMYNNDGSYHQQKVIDVTNARIGELNDSGNLVNSDLPSRAQAKYAPKDPRNENYQKYTEAEKQAIENAEVTLGDKPYDDGTNGQLSVFGDVTDADLEQMLSDASQDYEDAVARGDMEAAQEDVDFYAMKAFPNSVLIQDGKFFKMWHHTNAEFTSFLPGTSPSSGGLKGIYFTPQENSTMSALGERHNSYYLNVENMKFAFGVAEDKKYVEELKRRQKGVTDREELARINREFSEETGIDAFFDWQNGWYNVLVPEKIKSADVVTYDDQGNVIPLSERFSNSQDFRYSSGGEMTEADRDMSQKNSPVQNVVNANGWTIKNEQSGDFEDYALYDYIYDAKGKRIGQKLRDDLIYDETGDASGHAEELREAGFVYQPRSFNWVHIDEPNQALVNAGVITPEDLEAYQERVASKPLEGQNPTMSTGLGPAQRQFGQGMLQDSDDIDRMAKAYTAQMNTYFPDTNEDQVRRAIKWVRSLKATQNSDGYAEALQAVTANDFDYRSADGQARMLTVMAMAKARNNGQGDTMAQVALADAFNRQGTDLGRALQARKIFRLMTPEGRISTLQRMMQNMQNELDARGGKKVDLKFSDWIYQAAAAATEEGDYKKVYEAATEELAEQIPASWKDKLTGWRMLSMLGNPRTHIRNVLGNAMFIPMVGMKNKIGAIGEIVTGVKQGERTKTLGFSNPKAREFARNYAKAVEADLRGEAKYDDRNAVKRAQKTWGTGKSVLSKTLGKALQGLSDANSKALEWEDWIFLKGHFTRAMGGYMTANHLSPADMTGKTLEKATEYAIREAHKATYRDENSVSTALNNFSKRAKGTKMEKGAAAIQFAVDAILPFKKTPANILRRGIEYSPIGLASGILDAKAMVETSKYMKDNSNPKPRRMVTPTEFIDKISSGLTGTGVMVLGAVLGALGAANAGFDDDDPEDRLKKLEGQQEYDVNFGKALNALTESLFGVELFGEDISRTMDWAAPFSMPFFVGVALEKQLLSENKDDSDPIGTTLNALLGITEPVFNLSMLDGVNSLFNVSQYDPMNPATQIGMKVLLNYGSSFIPTLLGQVARIKDPVRRMNYVTSGTKPYQFFSTIEQVENKIPGLSEKNIPYRNAYGEEQSNGAWYNTLFAPWYEKSIRDDELTGEIRNVFENAKDEHPKLIPDTPPRYFKAGNETIRLDAEQYNQYSEVIGNTGTRLLNELIETDEYKIANADTKAEMMENIWTYATLKGRESIVGDVVKMEAWMTDGEKKGNIINALVGKTIEDKKEEYVSQKGIELRESLERGDSEAVSTIIYDLKDRMGIDPADIRKEVSEYFRPLYYQAYADDDPDAMSDIEDILSDFEIGYDKKTYSSWKSQAKQKYGEDESEEEETEPETDWLNMNN